MAELQVLIFTVGTERYGVNVAQVQSIERLLPITRVPRTLSFIKGVMNLRGVVIPVIDLRERFGFPSAEATDETRVIVVNLDNMTVGLIADAVIDVRTLDESGIEPPPSIIGGIQALYLDGIARFGDEVLILMNLPRVLSEVEAEQLRDVEKSVNG